LPAQWGGEGGKKRSLGQNLCKKTFCWEKKDAGLSRGRGGGGKGGKHTEICGGGQTG